MPKWVSWALRVMRVTLQAKEKGVACATPFRSNFLVGQGRLGLALDLDCPGLLLLRDHALELDGEQAVGELRTGDLHMVGQLEAALEVAAGDAAIEVLLALVGARRALAGDQQLVLLLGQV